jgi:hypothetical protein
MLYSTPVPQALRKVLSPNQNPNPNLVVEDYQIAFFCDNFFLLGGTTWKPPRGWFLVALFRAPMYSQLRSATGGFRSREARRDKDKAEGSLPPGDRLESVAASETTLADTPFRT